MGHEHHGHDGHGHDGHGHGHDGHGHGHDGHGHDGHGHDGHGHDGHGHGHGHHHLPSGTRALTWALALNGGFLLVEAGVGWWTQSLALLSDAAHMAGDVAALVLALGAARLAEVGASAGRTFGLRRAEVLGAFLNGLLLVLAVVWIVWEAAHRLGGEAPPVAGLPVLIVGGVGLAINLGSAWALHRSSSHDLNVRGALVHMLADALGSIGAMIAAGLVLAGFPAADAVVSVVIAGLVAYGTWGLLRDATRVLLQLPPPGCDVEGLQRAVLAVPGVTGLHDLHVWTLDGQSPIVTAHVVRAAGTDPEALQRDVLAVLAARRATHVTLQIEPPEVDCAHVDCGAPELSVV